MCTCTQLRNYGSFTEISNWQYYFNISPLVSSFKIVRYLRKQISKMSVSFFRQCLALPSEQLTFILSVTFIKQDMQLQSTLDLPQEPSWRVLMERSHNSLEQRLPKNGHEFMQPMFSFWSGIPGNQTHSTGYLNSVERNDNSPLLYGSIALVLSNFNQLLFNDNTLHLEIHRIFQYK